MEKLKCKIYKQILEQRLNIKLDDDVEDLISDAVERFVQWEENKKRKHEDEDNLNEKCSRMDEEENETKKNEVENKASRIFIENEGEKEKEEEDVEEDEFLDFFEDDDTEMEETQIKKKIDDLFLALQQPKLNSFSSVLCEIRQIRFLILEKFGAHKFIKTVESHLEKIKNIFFKKSFSETKIVNNIFPVFFSPLEYRLLLLDNLQKQTLEADEMVKFKSCLSIPAPQQFRPFCLDDFTSYILTYAIAFTSLQDLITLYFSHSMNIIFVQHQPDENFAFYTLKAVYETGMKHWNMDCRLENLTVDLGEIILTYCIDLFRNLYRKCLGTNSYIYGYENKCSLLEFECEQLLQTILISSDFHKLNRLLQHSVPFYMYFTDYDKFDLKKEDKDQLENFKTYALTNETITSVLHRLFDDLDKDTEKTLRLRFM